MADLNRVPSAAQPLVDTGSWTVTQPWFRFFAAIASAVADNGNGSGGGNASSAFVPTAIADGETFTVPENRQALFKVPIEVDGVLIVNGVLVEVD